ncbi:MAG: hypothetical protein H0V10_10285 [Geodermatophilaceae bacterium]|nr:hypothetical protein [Geodermatophilaceae bacterium]
MSLDHLLREGLDRAATAAPATDVEGSLTRVHLRRRRRLRVRQGGLSLAVAILVACLLVGTPVVLEELREPRDVVADVPRDPQGLDGVYAVEVGNSALAEQHGMAGHWVIELGRDGHIRLEPPEAFQGWSAGIAYGVAENEMRVVALSNDPVCAESPGSTPTGIYRWTAVADELLFTPVSETCAARQLLFAGQPWVEQP